MNRKGSEMPGAIVLQHAVRAHTPKESEKSCCCRGSADPDPVGHWWGFEKHDPNCELAAAL